MRKTLALAAALVIAGAGGALAQSASQQAPGHQSGNPKKDAMPGPVRAHARRATNLATRRKTRCPANPAMRRVKNKTTGSGTQHLPWPASSFAPKVGGGSPGLVASERRAKRPAAIGKPPSAITRSCGMWLQAPLSSPLQRARRRFPESITTSKHCSDRS